MPEHSAPSNGLNKVFNFICSWALPLGYSMLLCGMLVLPSQSTYTKFYYALICFPTLIAILIKPKVTVSFLKDPLLIIFITYLALTILSLIWSQPATDSDSLLKRPIYVLMLFFCCAFVFHTYPNRIKQSYTLACIIVLIYTIVSLAQFIIDYKPGLRMIGSGALSNPLLSSHIYGFFATFFIASFTTQRKLAYINIASFLVMFCAIIATGSRTPLLALFLVATWLTIATPNKRSIALISLIIVSAIAFLFLAPLPPLERGFSYRPEIWSLTIEKILQNPFFGYGYNTPLSVDPGIGVEFREPHNFELGVLYELGLVGFIIWLTMHLYALWRSWKFKTDPSFIVASSLLIFGIGAGLTEGGGIFSRPKEHWFLIWIPLALIFGLDSLTRAKAALNTTMLNLDSKSYNTLTEDGRIIEADGLGPKVIQLKDKSFFKIFRRKSIISSSSIIPYAKRFAANSEQLNKLGIIAPEILAIYKLYNGSTAVQYNPLPGETLRKKLHESKSETEKALLTQQFGCFLAELHKKGIYFRSLHLGNVLLLPSGKFGLIDLADMKISGRPLSRSMRIRNLKHMQRYAEDKSWLFETHLDSLISGYSKISPIHIVKSLNLNIKNQCEHS